MSDPNTVFKIERGEGVLVVLPQGPALKFPYKQVHLESNALFRIVDEPQFRASIIDLSAVDYVDSVIISSILRVCTKTKQKGGQTVFCNATEAMESILKTIKIGKLWPLCKTRDDAVAMLASQ
ncbi:MAG: hypothetical protein CMJ78_27845 [Planctomycetaceae bacterium]|nr:hypothetical protein [Planctomycetaceae bacterium]